MRIGWSSREGLVINTLSYTDGDQVRPVLYRASLAEMTVPYGDPSATQARKNAFDAGEYGMGMCANSLRLEVGTGSALTVKRLRVEWPTSGTVQARSRVIQPLSPVTTSTSGIIASPTAAPTVAKIAASHH